MFVWITGLGLLAKLSLGAGVVAVGLTGVGVAGATHILPGDVQAAFDDVVAVVVPFTDDEVADDQVADDEVADDQVADDQVADDQVADDEVAHLEVAHDEGDAQDAGDETPRIEDEESGRAQEDLYRESDDANEEIDVEKGDEVQAEQNVAVEVDNETETGSGSDSEVTVGSETDAEYSDTTPGGRP